MIAAAFAVGVALGVASSLAPGPCGLAVLTATRRRRRRRAVGIGVGAALGDAACASLASAGIGAWLADQAGSATLARLIGGAALFMLLYAFLHGPVLSGDSSDAARRPAVLLHLYIITRLLVAFGLGLPLEHPALAYSTAAALPLGLGAACLSNRFRPRPESLPPAPGS